MKMIKFVHAVDLKTVFKVNLGCCIERVVYEGAEIGVNAKNDHSWDEINSENLWCEICDPKLTLILISREEYENKLQMVNSMRIANSLGPQA